MFKNDRVQLLSFNGANISSIPEKGEQDNKHNNYWLLIGELGEIVDCNPSRGVSSDRVLVKFDINLSSLDLEAHNEVENSLWIKKSDLVKIA